MKALRCPPAPTLIIALIGVAVSVLAWFDTATWVDRSTKAEFNILAGAKSVFLKEGFIDYENLMQGYYGFIETAAGRIDPNRLNQYAGLLAAKYPGLSALAWVPRGESSAILYETSRQASSSIASFDFASDPGGRAVLAQARDSGQLVVSQLQRPFVPRGVDGPAIIAVRAVYASEVIPQSLAERRTNLTGFAVGEFRLSEMVDGILRRLTQPAGLHVYIYPQGATVGQLPDYIHTSGLATTPAPSLGLGAIQTRSHLSEQLDFGTRSWILVLVPIQQPRSGLWRAQPLAALGFCLMLSTLGATYNFSAGRKRRLDRLMALELRDSKQRLRTIFDSVNEGIFLANANTGVCLEVNDAGCEMFGYQRGELVGRNIDILSSGVPPYTESGVTETLKKARLAGPQKFEWQAKRNDGSLFWTEVSLRIALIGTEHLAVAVVHDVTERKQTNERIAQLAHYDLLTGLANRRVFVEALDQTIARAGRGGKSFAVLYLDLDHFKDVNDTLGHPIGDLLLQAVADRLRGSVRATDTVARFGGDEFAVIVSEIQDRPEVEAVSDRSKIDISDSIATRGLIATAGQVAETIVKELSRPFSIRGNEIHSGATVGIAVFGPDSGEAETMLSHADEALYQAKSKRRGSYRFFTGAMDAEVRERVRTISELREAITSQQFFLEYEPQVAVDSGHIVGVEALVRWRHPTKGILGPRVFTEVAEATGLIVPLGRWVMREACRQARHWLDAGIASPVVSINISGVQCKAPLDLEGDIAAMLAQFALPASCIQLELTETALMQASKTNNELLRRLRKTGLRIAIDDFGSGYSSLDYLRRYPVDRFKIGKRFTDDVGKGPENDAIVRAVLGLGRELGIEVVVEGVETQMQITLLRSWGCRLAQGFYFAKPLSVAEVTGLLQAGKVLPGDRVAEFDRLAREVA